MNAEFFSAIEDIEKEKGIPRQYMYEKIHQAMLAAFRKDNPEAADNVVIEMSEEKRKIDMYILMDVVEEVENPATQLTLDAAKSVNKRAKVGGQVKVPVETKKFGRIAAPSAKQVIIQGIREAERGIVYEEFTSKEHEILTGIVQRIDPRMDGVALAFRMAGRSPRLSRGMIRCHPPERGCQRIDVACGKEKAVPTHEFRYAAHGTADDGQPHADGLQHGVRERFGARRQDERVNELQHVAH